MKKYNAPLIIDEGLEVVRTLSIAGAFAAGALAALGTALRGDKIVERSMMSLEPCID